VDTELRTGGEAVLGLMYLGAAVLYLAVMFVVMRWAWRAGRAGGGSRLRASGYALVGFLVVYLPVFWNHIPVLLIQQARCAKDAGFTVFVTAEQWVSMNKEFIHSARGLDLDRTTPSREVSSGFSRYEFLGGALAREMKTDVDRKLGVEFGRSESRLIDVRTGQLLTLDISYGIGPRDDARFWLVGHGCPRRQSGAMYPFIQYHTELKELLK
jgi:hypothetical protein